MLIPGEKGDSETDSTDLIIYGLCLWLKRNPEKLKPVSNKWLQDKEYHSVCTAGKQKSFCYNLEKELMWGNCTDFEYLVVLISPDVKARHLFINSKLFSSLQWQL